MSDDTTTTTPTSTDTNTNSDTGTFTVTVLIGDTELVRQVEGTHWRRDDSRNVFVYDSDTAVMEVESEYFVEIVREDNINPATTYSCQ